jgi:hypothetical protein
VSLGIKTVPPRAPVRAGTLTGLLLLLVLLLELLLLSLLSLSSLNVGGAAACVLCTVPLRLSPDGTVESNPRRS